MSEHDGHRARMKNRFLEHGLENFDDHAVLELLLFYAMPRQDTNPAAHRLMDTFGSLDAVFEANIEQLTAVKGIGESAATLLHLVPAVSRRYLLSRAALRTELQTSAEAGQYLLPYFVNSPGEQVFMISLDNALHVLDCSRVGDGESTSVGISIRAVVTAALQHKADNVILAHNHPNGIARPSDEDIAVTHRLREALSVVGITLADHIIVAGDSFISLADEGQIG